MNKETRLIDIVLIILFFNLFAFVAAAPMAKTGADDSTYKTVENAYVYTIELGSPPQSNDMVFTDKGNFYCSRIRTFEIILQKKYEFEVDGNIIYFVKAVD